MSSNATIAMSEFSWKWRQSFRALALLLLPVLVAVRLLETHRATKLPVRGQVPDFSLTDQTGRRVRLASFAGEPWIADFIFTKCAATCPMLTSRFSKLQGDLQGTPVRLVSFTVDPRRDTPAVLAKYGKMSHAEDGRWFFLTGKKDEIYRL